MRLAAKGVVGTTPRALILFIDGKELCLIQDVRVTLIPLERFQVAYVYAKASLHGMLPMW